MFRFPEFLIPPLVFGLAVGLIMASRRLHPFLVFFSMWAAFLLLAQGGNSSTIPMPFPLLASGGGMLILLLVGIMFLGVAFWSFTHRNGA